MGDDDTADGPISRRRILKGAATAVIGTAALNHKSNAQAQSQAQNQTQTHTTTTGQPTTTTTTTTTPDESDPPTVYLGAVDSDPAEGSYSYQTEFELDTTFYPYARVDNINHDGLIRIGIQWYIVGGGGLYDKYSNNMFTFTDASSWRFWWPLSTVGYSSESRDWTHGQYIVYLTITDFTTGLSTTETADIRLI